VDGRLSLDAYLIGAASAAATNALSNYAHAITDALSDVIDTDRDDRVIDVKFVRLMNNVWGVPRPEAPAAFTGLDADGSGVVAPGRLRCGGVLVRRSGGTGSRVFGDL
jgi:hypothetical protein